MAWPTITADIAFNTAPYAAVPDWNDVSNVLLDFSIVRGRQYELDNAEAGTAMLTLRNATGDFWPLNTGGTHYPNVLPGKRIRIRATYGITTYSLFTGFIESWDCGFAGDGTQVPIVRLTCSDLLSHLARYKINDAGGRAAEKSDKRIEYVLDELGWPSGVDDRELEAGQTTVQAVAAFADVVALTHVRAVELAEGGLFWIAANGEARFLNRYHRYLYDDTSQATYGDDPGELGYREPVYAYDDQHIYNDVRLTRTGGSEQAVSNATSQTAYGTRSYQKTGLLNNSDGDLLDRANYLIGRYKDPEFRLQSIRIQPEGDPSNLWPDILGFEWGTRITVRLDAASLDADYHVEGIRHDVVPGTWVTTWLLSPANAQAFWVLDSLTNSIVGTTTRLAY